VNASTKGYRQLDQAEIAAKLAKQKAARQPQAGAILTAGAPYTSESLMGVLDQAIAGPELRERNMAYGHALQHPWDAIDLFIDQGKSAVEALDAPVITTKPSKPRMVKPISSESWQQGYK
jgi:hypothetical protein